MGQKTIISAEEYEFAVLRVEKLKGATPGSEEAKELRVLTKLVREFEVKWPIARPKRLK